MITQGGHVEGIFFNKDPAELADLQPRGGGFFKFNGSWLEDNEYIEMVKKVIENFILNNSYMEDKGLLWDCLKCEIRGQTVSYSSALTRERLKPEKELIDKISVLESDLDESCVDEYNSYKSELEHHQSQRIHDTIKGQIYRV